MVRYNDGSKAKGTTTGKVLRVDLSEDDENIKKDTVFLEKLVLKVVI